MVFQRIYHIALAPEHVRNSPNHAAFSICLLNLATPSAVSCWTTSEVGTPMDVSSSTPQTPVPFPSPALSISSIVRSGNRKFQGQSPAPFVPATVDLSNHHEEVSKNTTLQEIMQQTRNFSPESLLASKVSTPASEVMRGVVLQHSTSASMQRYRQHEEDTIREELIKLERESGEQSSIFLECLYELGSVLFDQGRYKAAEETARKAVRISEGSQGTCFTIKSYVLLGVILIRQGFYQESGKVFQKAVELSIEELGSNDVETLDAMDGLAAVLILQGKYEEAEKLGKKNLNLSREIYGTKHQQTMICMSTLEDAVYQQGRFKEAEKLALYVVEARLERDGEYDDQTLTSIAHLATTYRAQGRLEEAKNLTIYVLERRQKILGEEHSSTLYSLYNLAVVYAFLDRLDEAEKLGIYALAKRRSVLGNDHPNTIDSELGIANIYAKQERFREAADLGRQALIRYEKIFGPDHPKVMNAIGVLSQNLKRMGQVEEAKNYATEVSSASN